MSEDQTTTAADPAATDAAKLPPGDPPAEANAAAPAMPEPNKPGKVTPATAAKPLDPEALAVLRAATESRYGLYEHRDGSTVTGYGVDGAEFGEGLIAALVKSGHLYADATGGNHGSVKVTAKGRAAAGAR